MFTLSASFRSSLCFFIIYATAVIQNNSSSAASTNTGNITLTDRKNATICEGRKKKSRLGILNEPISNYQVPASITELLQSIDADKKIVDAARPLPESIESTLNENLTLEWVYHSNSIEGINVSLSETKTMLEGLTGQCKSHKEFFQIVNHNDAIRYIFEVARNKDQLNEYQIRNIHSTLMTNINYAVAGIYREHNVNVKSSETDPPNFVHIPSLMGSLIEWHRSADGIHPIVRAAILHTRFVMIHPFVDGNGRTGRLLMNFDLMKDGYPPTVIDVKDRSVYDKAIETACQDNNYTEIITLIAESAHRSIKMYVKSIQEAGLEKKTSS